MSRRQIIEQHFPRLPGSEYSVTSPMDDSYNCIAWATGRQDQWWWPAGIGPYYWPDGVPPSETIDAFIMAFEKEGFARCDSGELEEGFEKVAIYARGGVVTHAARQVPSGAWTSKLGELEDIEHAVPDDVGGTIYGEVAVFMRRLRSTS